MSVSDREHGGFDVFPVPATTLSDRKHVHLRRGNRLGFVIDVDVDWIANAALTRHLKAMQANHVLVVADSCYSGALFRNADASLERKGERNAWIDRMNEKRSRTAIASGGLEPMMDSGGGRHSAFA